VKNCILNTVRNYKFPILTLTAFLLAGGACAQAGTGGIDNFYESNPPNPEISYTSTTATTAWNAARWRNFAVEPSYTNTYAANQNVSFTSGSYTFAGMGSALNVGNITLGNNVSVNFATIGSSFSTGGAVRTINLGSGSTFDFNSQGMSTALGTGIIISGSGVFATGNYTSTANAQSFTINGGTVIARGTTGLGNGSASVLNLNGGTLASNATRAFDNTRFGGGIVIGGNMQFGGLSTNVALADSSASLSFANNVSLGTGVRTFTLGNNGTQTFSGIISNSSGGITFSANSGLTGTGRFDITGTANTFTGPINITAGEARFTADESLGNSANTIVIDGGRLATASAATYTITAGRGIAVGDGAGTSISTTGAGTLTYNGVIANKSVEIGSWAKQGAGTLVLGGVSTYTGNTAIEAGLLQLTGGNDRLPTGTVVSLGSIGTTLGTLDLNGQNQRIAGLVSTTGTVASGSVKNTVTSTTAATLEINVAEGTTKSYGGGTTQNSGVIGGLLGLTKSGLGTQVLGDANTYSGTTTVNAGTLVVNGSITSSSAVVNGGLLNVNGTAAAVTVNSGGNLGGSGKVGAITGAGTIGPGNSPGILTATSVNPTTGTDFKFEFTSLSPTYTSATASGNDLLHLTAASPFAGGTFTAGNIISIYLNSATITTSLLAGNNTTFSGAFFVDGTYELAAALSSASFAYYTTSSSLGTGSALDYNGTSYYLLDSTIAAKTTLSDTAVTGAGFATGAATGTLLTFNAVPEPSAQSLLAIGMVALVAVRSLRRKQS
jgi:autotransporter-associated beta strand protein